MKHVLAIIKEYLSLVRVDALIFDSKKRRRGSHTLVVQKRRRRLLPFVPTKDPPRQLVQLGSHDEALRAHGMEFCNELTYVPGMADRSENQAKFKKGGGIQILSREDIATLELCKAMNKRGNLPPLLETHDEVEGYVVQADGHIKDMTLIGEYAGDVDYFKNQFRDDSDSMMTLISATNFVESLVICPDKHGNILTFISGINNSTRESKKKVNIKCLRYDVYGECRVILVAARDIAKGERLYYGYNGHKHTYPTHNFF
ncbi:probable Histone-lysine N-methyltransferase ATXR5 [Andrographis paniculata]|uniref:probable Histone-lysine N-methyltransferase ATXR5 n=1 Tax=Andrographis paniculata TaxID=175694 RepID=UPI0021E77723|nr:probable Histone-lysine N-methyltransferase ATXR5 [Andrographis paniculata]